MKCKYGEDDKKCETSRIKYKYYNCFLEHTNFKDDSIEYKGLYCDKYYHQKFDEKVNKNFLIHTNFLTTTIKSLFYCCEKAFILMNIWMIRKKSMKHHYLKIKNRVFK